MKVDLCVFKNNDIRGLFPSEIDEEFAFKLGRALARFLNAKTLIVGQDTRPSSDVLREAMVLGIRSYGCNVLFIGQSTTPLFYYSVFASGSDGGVMISASHLSSEYNGFKLCGKDYLISSDNGLEQIDTFMNEDNGEKTGEIGSVSDASFKEQYLKFIYDNSGLEKNEFKQKVVIDNGNGMAGLLIPEILKDFQIDYVPLYFEIDNSFPNRHPDVSRRENLENLKKKVIEQKADLGIAFDGDGDRIVFLDRFGNKIDQDYVLLILAEDILRTQKEVKAVFDYRMSKSVQEVLRNWKIEFVRLKPGHANIKNKMKEIDANLGAEISGHTYFGLEINNQKTYIDSAILTMLKMFSILARQDKTIDVLVVPFKRYFSSGEIDIDLEKGMNFDDIEKLIKEKYSDAEFEKIDGIGVIYPDWWSYLRLSRTEFLLRLIVEARNQELLEEKTKELQSLIRR